MFSEPITFDVIVYSIAGLIVVPVIIAGVLFVVKKVGDKG